MRNKFLSNALVVLALLGGCATMAASDRLFMACSGYTTVLEQLVPNKRAMPASMQARVSEIIPVARKICSEQNVSAIDQLEGLITELLRMRKGTP